MSARRSSVAAALRRHPGSAVVAGWGLLNVVLLGIAGLYRESGVVLLIWVASSLLVFVAALAVLVSSRRGPREHVRYRLPSGGGAVAVIAAVAAGLVGLSFLYGFWLIPLALAVLAAAVVPTMYRGRRGPVQRPGDKAL